MKKATITHQILFTLIILGLLFVIQSCTKNNEDDLPNIIESNQTRTNKHINNSVYSLQSPSNLNNFIPPIQGPGSTYVNYDPEYNPLCEASGQGSNNPFDPPNPIGLQELCCGTYYLNFHVLPLGVVNNDPIINLPNGQAKVFPINYMITYAGSQGSGKKYILSGKIDEQGNWHRERSIPMVNSQCYEGCPNDGSPFPNGSEPLYKVFEPSSSHLTSPECTSTAVDDFPCFIDSDHTFEIFPKTAHPDSSSDCICFQKIDIWVHKSLMDGFFINYKGDNMGPNGKYPCDENTGDQYDMVDHNYFFTITWEDILNHTGQNCGAAMDICLEIPYQ